MLNQIERSRPTRRAMAARASESLADSTTTLEVSKVRGRAARQWTSSTKVIGCSQPRICTSVASTQASASPYSSIIRLTPYVDGLGMFTNGGKPQVFITRSGDYGWFVYNLVRHLSDRSSTENFANRPHRRSFKSRLKFLFPCKTAIT